MGKMQSLLGLRQLMYIRVRCAVKGYGHMMVRRVFIPTWEVVLGDKIKLLNGKICNL
jgi:hypothetical protein